MRSFLGGICNMLNKKGFHSRKSRGISTTGSDTDLKLERAHGAWIWDGTQSLFLEKIGFVSCKGEEKMRIKFLGSKKEVLMIPN